MLLRIVNLVNGLKPPPGNSNSEDLNHEVHEEHEENEER